MRRALHDAWWRLVTTPPNTLPDRLLSGLLQGGAWLYGFGIGLRNGAYDRKWIRPVAAPCPVISVGNLSLGGTGKTTCVEYLTNWLAQRGRRVCILSRGYGGYNSQPYALIHQDGQLRMDGQPVGANDGLPDEPRLLASHLSGTPVLVGARRERTGAMAASHFQAEAVILDDGLQYRRLARDCEIVLINARMPLGGWALFPRGPMREPLGALRRADVILITKADQSLDVAAALQERLQAINPEALIGTTIHEPDMLRDGSTGEPVALSHLAGERVNLLSSIGDPDGFEQTVRGLGATVESHAAYPDHHPYRREEWQETLQAAAAAKVGALVTTEKDWIRLERWTVDGGRSPVPVRILGIRMRFLSGEEQLHDRLAAVCAG